MSGDQKQTPHSTPYRLSVIITGYNSRDWIERAIKSILTQNDPIGVEVIVVDDGSTDETLSYLKGVFYFEMEQGRLKLTDSDRTGDIGLLRNLGAARSTGSFLTFLSATDWWRPGRLQALEHWLSHHDLILYTPQTPWKSSDWIRALLSEHWVTSSAVVIRRGLFEQANGFPEGYSGRVLPKKIPGLEDYELWIRAVAELIQSEKKERLVILKNEHVVTDPHPLRNSPLQERLQRVKQAVSLLHVAPNLPWKYWPEVAKNIASSGRSWIKPWR